MLLCLVKYVMSGGSILYQYHEHHLFSSDSLDLLMYLAQIMHLSITLQKCVDALTINKVYISTVCMKFTQIKNQAFY